MQMRLTLIGTVILIPLVYFLPYGYAVERIVFAFAMAGLISTTVVNLKTTSNCICIHERELVLRDKIMRIITALIVLGLAFYALTLGLPYLALMCAWFAMTHIIAAVISYAGCPELGIVSCLITKNKHSYTGCGPWCKLDKNK